MVSISNFLEFSSLFEKNKWAIINSKSNLRTFFLAIWVRRREGSILQYIESYTKKKYIRTVKKANSTLLSKVENADFDYRNSNARQNTLWSYRYNTYIFFYTETVLQLCVSSIRSVFIDRMVFNGFVAFSESTDYSQRYQYGFR